MQQIMQHVLLFALVGLVCGASPDHQSEQQRPNFVFIMSDDQDLLLDSMVYMPAVNKLIRDEGTELKRHYCTVSLCCPSRVSLLTGKAAHNTNVTDVIPPYGGYLKFLAEGLQDHYLPIWLQDAGYNTFYTGKLLNGLGETTPVPPGWTSADFLVGDAMYQYYNVTMRRDHGLPVHYNGQYSTDVIAGKALTYIDEAAKGDPPFFLGIAPTAPHAELFMQPAAPPITSIPKSADRHKSLFPEAKVPRTTNFNPDTVTGAGFFKTLPRQNQTVIDYQDGFYRKRLQALQALDELVEQVFERLSTHGLLENTYVIFTSDNGYHLGQHRLAPGKSCGIETDIHVPFYIRGPGIAANETFNHPTTHTDLTPTIFRLADIPLHADFDGIPISLNRQKCKGRDFVRPEHVNVEYWGRYEGEGEYAGPLVMNNTFKEVRVISEEYDLAYMTWCTNERELYDLKTDPYQMNNLAGLPNAVLEISDSKYSVEHVSARLDALIMILKTCSGRSCVQPWRELHPDGGVGNLEDALQLEFDSFYESQPKMSYKACTPGFIKSAELGSVQVYEA